MKKIITIILIALSLNLSAQLKAFPTAFGGGAYATGGRGQSVYHVTNLNDSGAGSFRDAVSQGNRTIVFDVSGIIQLTSNLNIDGSDNNPVANITIAGQSAPEGGITIASPANGNDAAFEIRIAENIIMRYIRVRSNFESENTFRIRPSSDNNTRFSRNIMLDHLSLNWAEIQAFSITNQETHSITLQNSMLAESTRGVLFGDTDIEGNSYNNTFRNNTLYHISHRLPNTSSGRADIYNNVIYDWSERLTTVKLGTEVNQFNNFYYLGNRTDFKNTANPPFKNVNGAASFVVDDANATLEIYSKGNIIENVFTDPIANNEVLWVKQDGTSTNQTIQVPSNRFRDIPFTMIGAVPSAYLTAVEASTSVPQDSGAYKYLNADGSVGIYRDEADTKYVNEITTNTPSSWDSTFESTGRHSAKAEQIYANHLADITGTPINTRPANFYVSNAHIPEVWFKANVPDGEDHNDLAPSGYTWLEEYLNQVDVQEVVTPPTPTSPDKKIILIFSAN